MPPDGDKAVKMDHHERPMFRHRVRDAYIVRVVVSDILIGRHPRNDAGDLTACSQNGIGDGIHEPDRGVTVDAGGGTLRTNCSDAAFHFRSRPETVRFAITPTGISQSGSIRKISGGPF